jgi:hypothetical protein
MKAKTQSFSRLIIILIAASAAIISANGDSLDNWTPANVDTSLSGGPYGSVLRSVAFGNGRWVAVGQYASSDNASIQTSEDGINWALRTTGDFSIFDLFDVTYANGVFVAVGWDAYFGRNIYSSTNGINWTPHTTTPATFYAVTYGKGRFVAVGNTTNDQNIYFSTNGANWVATDSGSYPNYLRDVAYGANIFVAVDGAGYLYQSSNGTFWTSAANDRASDRISFCNGLFFVPAGQGTNLISSDGLNWTLVTNNTGDAFGHVINAGGVFVALGGTNVYSSMNGTNWQKRNFQITTNGVPTDLAFGAQNIVITGYASPSVPTSRPLAYVSEPLVFVAARNSFPPQLTISGLTGRTYRIDILTDVTSSSWQNLTNLNLTNGPVTWTDMQATNSSRFYRAVLLP